MPFLNNDIPENFIFDITTVPGSGDEVCLKAIDYYVKQLENPELPEELKEIARSFIGNLTEYYEMANFNSVKLREALPHLSESARFMESKSSIDMDVESSGRIKSFYSTYQKILEKIIECVEEDKTIPEHGLLKDIYATRDILHPRHDMRLNPQAFYKLTYKTILEYMDFIDNLGKTNPGYELIEISEKTRRDLERPKKYTYSPNDAVTVPEKDFIDYSLESKGIGHGFRYLADLSDDLAGFTIAEQALALQDCDLSDPRQYSDLIAYKLIESQTQKDFAYKLRNYYEKQIINALDDQELKDYYSLDSDEFLENYGPCLPEAIIDTYKFVSHMNYCFDKNKSFNQDFPKFTSSHFTKDLSITLNYFKELQKATILEKLQEIKDLDLHNFSDDLKTACKIRHYSRCSKDYMKNPKAAGYQSFHLRIKTPFGIYEKQIRTEDQDRHAEKGHASHSLTYKPDVKTSFHRLKVPKPFSPKRDANGDLIIPTQLGILPLEFAVTKYYGTPFTSFSGGKTFDEFKSQFITNKGLENEEFNKTAYDQALLDLTHSSDKVMSKKINKFSEVINTFFKKIFPKNEELPVYEPDMAENITSMFHEEVPEDVATYPSKSKVTNTPLVTSSSGAPSTDDTDPHDNR